MHRISRVLIDRILDSTNPVQAIGDIGQYIGPRDRNASDLGLSRPEMNFCLFRTYDAEVGRNGHAWFFLNPPGDEVIRTLDALAEMSLAGPRAILLEACSVFPNSYVHNSREERIKAVRGLPYKETMALWNRLDREYGDWGILFAAMKQAMNYLRNHRYEILKSETA